MPVVPIVIKFRENKGIRKLFKKKKAVTLTVLKPIMQEQSEDRKQDIEELKNKVHEAMQNISAN